MNAASFKFSCPRLPATALGRGAHDIRFYAVHGALPVVYYTFYVYDPSTTPVYVVNPTLVKTSLIPTTTVSLTTSFSTTRTLTPVISRIYTATGTTTCTVTVTASGAATATKNARDAVAPQITEIPWLDPGLPTSFQTIYVASKDPLEVTMSVPDMVTRSEANNVDVAYDEVEELKQRDGSLLATLSNLLHDRAAAPTLGRPDYTYPPYGVTTIYVSRFTTYTNTRAFVSTFTVTPPGVTTMVGYVMNTVVTVTVTKTAT
jgi:hypothetical protein